MTTNDYKKWNHSQSWPESSQCERGIRHAIKDANSVWIIPFQDYISNIAEAVVQKEESEEFMLEAVGILGNLTIPDLDYELLLNEFELVPWIKLRLQPGGCYVLLLGLIHVVVFLS